MTPDTVEGIKKLLDLSKMQQDMIDKLVACVKLQAEEINQLKANQSELTSIVERMDADLRV